MNQNVHEVFIFILCIILSTYLRFNNDNVNNDEPDMHDDFAPQKKSLGGENGDEGVKTFIANMLDEASKSSPVMLFMKGTPDQPQCGFSAQVVRCLHASGVDFNSCNVLASDELREGIKAYSDWPTIPQLYISKEFVGGCDIVTSMFQEGELQEMLEEAGATESKE